MKSVYPIVLTKLNEGGFLVYVPDLQINTEGTDITNAIEMARDAIGIWGLCEIDANRTIPKPSDILKIEHSKNDIVTLVDIDFKRYRDENDNRSIRKNVTIPYWLNAKAEKAGVNFSGILQKGLIQELHIDV